MEYKSVLTTCPYCGCGCGFYLESIDGQLVGTIPSKTSPVNKGKLCIKGWNVHEFVQHPKRLTKPLLRKNGQLEEVSWDEALDFTADKLRQIKNESGPDSVAFFASAKVTNEENYLLQKFARAGVGTNNVDHCARL
jgi:predicted molibdopterin-dependent oxidoreductase YjgC